MRETTMRRFTFVLAAATALLVSGFGCGGDENFKYDPENYKAQIQNIEGLLSKPQNEPGDGGKLHIYSTELASAVGQQIQNHNRKETVMNIIISYGETFAHQEQQSIPWDIGEARTLWKQLRETLFMDADWFQTL